MIVVGTAGHIDHGKSAIVKRLTGTDPDRLPEEKARGMTIDLGFAFMAGKSGEEISFVDVPGHERFVKNMIAGAGGIDVVMLVIAADDGWMPQSEEHFQIVRLLGVKSGLIVVNKSDLVENDWLDLLDSDIKERTKGSFLEQAPVFRVSATNGDGFDKLRGYLETLPGTIRKSSISGQARLFVDRSFIRPGIGKVVTGTLRGGELSIGQTVTIWPGNVSGRIRSLQSNGRDVEQAVSGQRTAVSITGIDRECLVRGAVITDRQDLSEFVRQPILALKIELLQNCPITLTDRRRVLLIIGTTEVEGEVRIFSDRKLGPGATGILFFKPDNPICCLVGDRFIVRLPTPMVTLGGGTVLDHLGHLPRKKLFSDFNYLNLRCSDNTNDLVLSELQKNLLTDRRSLLSMADVADATIKTAVEGLEHKKTVGRIGSFVYLRESLELAVSDLKSAIGAYLQEHPHLKGLSVEQISRLINQPEPVTIALTEYLVAQGELVKIGQQFNLAGRGMSLKGNIKKAHDRIMDQLKEHPYAPPKLTELASGGKEFREAIKFILETGQGHKCGSEFLFPSESWEKIVSFISVHLKEHNSLTVSELKNRFGFSRKYAIPILEETDRIGLTVRDGDSRRKGDRFENSNPSV